MSNQEFYVGGSKDSPGQKKTPELVNFSGIVSMLGAGAHVHGILVILLLDFPLLPVHLCNFEIRAMERVQVVLDRVDKAQVGRKH